MRGNVLDAVAAFGDVAPERVEIVGLGELPGHADHRDRLRPHHTGLGGIARAPGCQRHDDAVGRCSAGGGRLRDRLCRRGHDRCGNRDRFLRHRGFLAHMARELRQRRVAVDLDRLDRGAVMLVDPADPCDAGDRIQPQIDKLFVVADLRNLHPQLLREQAAQMRGHGGRIGCECGCTTCPDRRGRRGMRRSRRGRHRNRRSDGRGGDDQRRLRGFLAYVARELRQRRVAVDLDRLDRGAVMLVDPADPCHAGDRIQPKVDELIVVADLGDLHPQFVREQAAQMHGNDGRIEIARGYGGGLRSGGGHRLWCWCRSHCAVRGESALDARQRIGLADEGLRVHVQLARIGVVERRAQRRGPALFQREQSCARLARDALRHRHCGRQHVFARQHRLAQAARFEIGAGVILCGEQGFAREIAADAQREHQSGAGARREAVAHVRTEVAAFRGEQREVGIHAHRPTRTDAMALHRRDHRQRTGQRQLKHQVVGEFRAAVMDRQQGVAGAAGREVMVVSGEHDHFVCVARGHVREHILHAAGERGRKHVLGFAVGHAHFENAARMRGRGDFGIAHRQRRRRGGSVVGRFGIGMPGDNGRGDIERRRGSQRFGIAALPIAQRRQRQRAERVDCGQRRRKYVLASLHACNAEGIA